MNDYSIILSNGKIIRLKANSIGVDNGQVWFFNDKDDLIGVAPPDACVLKGTFNFGD